MFKKIAHCIVLVSLALQLGLFCSVGTLQAADEPAVPESAQLQSEEFRFDLGVITNKEIQKGSRSKWMQQGVNYFIGRGITILATIAGSVAVLMMVWGGFQMIISVTEDGYTHGKDTIKSAAIGLVFVLVAYIMVITVQLLIKSING